MSWTVAQTGGSSPSLEASNAEVSSLVKLFFMAPAVAASAITDPDVEIEIG